VSDELAFADDNLPASLALTDSVDFRAEPTSTGRILRAAREAQGLSVDDVTDVLRFSRRQVEAIECDDYKSLPGATLVRGFVRSYAKLLKLAPEPLLAAISPAVPPSAVDVRPPSNIGVADAGQPMGLSFRPAILLIAVVVMVAAVVGGYFFLNQGSASPTVEPTAAVPAVTAQQVNETAKVGDLPPASAAVAAPAMPPSTALVFEFDANSWIEVRDATQKTVFVGEYPRGTRQVVDGVAPFQVWIGKSSAVRLTYGERSIDLKPFTREDVARLVVE
jgi:cytoskeleton protein RodZ